jgi:Leucine-rich repeat (LRR) protein
MNRLLLTTALLFLASASGSVAAQTDSLVFPAFDPLEAGGTGWERAPLYTSLEAALAVEDPHTVYRLDLSRQRLKTVPEELARFTELRELRLDRNKLKTLPAFLASFSHLEIFSAEENELTAFPDAMWSWPRLKELRLGDNWIEAIPLNIDACQELNVLALWSNVIGTFPASLSELPQLQRLDLLNNEMTAEEQELLRIWLPDVQLDLSQPCRCEFED